MSIIYNQNVAKIFNTPPPLTVVIVQQTDQEIVQPAEQEVGHPAEQEVVRPAQNEFLSQCSCTGSGGRNGACKCTSSTGKNEVCLFTSSTGNFGPGPGVICDNRGVESSEENEVESLEISPDGQNTSARG